MNREEYQFLCRLKKAKENCIIGIERFSNPIEDEDFLILTNAYHKKFYIDMIKLAFDIGNVNEIKLNIYEQFLR